MAIQPSVRYVRTGGSMVAKPVSLRVSGAWQAVQDVPNAPTSVVANPGNGTALVSWTDPAFTGGIPITSYTVTSTPGSLSATASTTSATVSGLTNGTAYTFKVKATNAVGTGVYSAASASVTPSAAITGSMYLSPASGNYAVGSSFTVIIRENSLATAVNSIQANITYDPAVLQFISADTSASPFTTTLQNTGGSGSVQIGVGSLSGTVTGDQPIATISFTVLSAATTNATVAGTSAIYRASDAQNVLNSSTGGIYTTT